ERRHLGKLACVHPADGAIELVRPVDNLSTRPLEDLEAENVSKRDAETRRRHSVLTDRHVLSVRTWQLLYQSPRAAPPADGPTEPLCADLPSVLRGQGRT